VTPYTYTTWGGVASTTDPRGNTTTLAYTARHQIQTALPRRLGKRYGVVVGLVRPTQTAPRCRLYVDT
jgi:hypothetical protein